VAVKGREGGGEKINRGERFIIFSFPYSSAVATKKKGGGRRKERKWEGREKKGVQS